MKILYLLILVCSTISLTKCKSPSTEVMDSFETLNKSLDKSNSVLDISLDNLYSSIHTSKRLNPSFKMKADSIFSATTSVYNFIDSIQHIMQLNDSSGSDLDLPENIFIKSKTGDTLAQGLLSVYKCSYAALVDTSKRSSLDSVLIDINEFHTDIWKKRYFKGTPTVAAITILNKFKIDCTNAATISLLTIKRHLTD